MSIVVQQQKYRTDQSRAMDRGSDDLTDVHCSYSHPSEVQTSFHCPTRDLYVHRGLIVMECRPISSAADLLQPVRFSDRGAGCSVARSRAESKRLSTISDGYSDCIVFCSVLIADLIYGRLFIRISGMLPSRRLVTFATCNYRRNVRADQGAARGLRARTTSHRSAATIYRRSIAGAPVQQSTMLALLIQFLTLALAVSAWPSETGTQLHLLGGPCLNVEDLVEWGADPILYVPTLR